MNTKTQHTPGPWRLAEGRENSNGINDFIWSDAASREEREDASNWCIATVHAREERSTRVANAKLIAAAPEMAEALRNALRALNTVECPLTSMQLSVVSDIERTLAKAGLAADSPSKGETGL